MADYVISGEITGDSQGFTDAVVRAQDSISSFGENFSDLTSEISEGAKDWGLDLDKFYNKGTSLFKKFGIDIDQFASHFGMSGKLMSGIVAVTVALEKLGNTMDEAVANIARGTGATGESLYQFGENLQEVLIGGVSGSVNDVSQSMADLNTRFGVTGDELINLTNKLDSFSRVTGENASTAVKNLGDITHKWGLSNSDVIPLMNQLTKASQMSGATIDELSSGLTQGQSIFSQFGMSVTDSIAFLGNLSQSGIDSSTAINGMKTALSKFSSEGKNAEVELRNVSEQIRNASSESEALQISLEVFGTRTGAEMVRVFRESSSSISDFANELYIAGDALENTESSSRTVSQATTELKNALLGTFGDFGRGISSMFITFIDIVTKLVQMLSPVIAPIGAIFKETFNFISNVIALFAENIKKFHDRFNVVFKAIANILKTVKDAMHSTLNNLFRIFKNIFGLIFAIIDGKWQLAWEYTKNTVMRAAKIILDFLSTIVNAFSGMINGMINGINLLIKGVNALRRALGKEELNLLDMFDGVDLSESSGLNESIERSEAKIRELSGETSRVLIGDIGAVREESETVTGSIIDDELELSEVTDELSTNTGNTVTTTTQKIKDEVAETTEQASNNFENMFKKIKNVFNKMKSLFSKFGSMFSKLIKINPDEVTNEMLKISDSILTFFVETLPNLPGLFQAGANIFSSMLDGITNFLSSGGVTQIFNILFNFLDTVVKFISSDSFINSIGTVIVEGIPRIIQFIISNIGTILSSMVDLATNIAGSLVEAFFNTDWIQVGKAILDGIWGAIKSLVRGVGNIFSGIGKGIGRLFGFASGVNNAPSGLALVGEQGPELVDFRGGERVYNANDTRNILGGQSAGNNFNVTFNNIEDTSAYTMLRELKNYQRQMSIKGVL